MKNKSTIIGIAIFIILIFIIIGIKFLGSEEGSVLTNNLTTVYVATGGGKEDLLADKRVNDLVLSVNIASQGIMMISDMYTRNSEMSQRIESLKVNTLVLWRAGISALRNAPDKDKMEKVCGIEDVISAAISNIIR